MGRLEGLPEPFERWDFRGLALRPQPLLDVGEAEPGALLGAGDRAREVSMTAAPVAHRTGPHARDPRDVRRGHLYLLFHLSLASLSLIRLTRHYLTAHHYTETWSRTSQWVVANVSAKWLSRVHTHAVRYLTEQPKPAFTRYPVLVIAGRGF